jgi:hypothetical protein
MNYIRKIAFASVLVLSGAVPAVAAHPAKMNQAAEHLQGERVRPHGAMDARAYAPENAPGDARAYAPNDAPVGIGPDFGIGSQS